DRFEALSREQARREARAQALDESIARMTTEATDAELALAEAMSAEAPSETLDGLKTELTAARAAADAARAASAQARADRDAEARERTQRAQRLAGLERERDGWTGRGAEAAERIARLEGDAERTR